MLADSDGAHTRSTSTVRNSECLVQIEMADVSSKVSRRSKANLGVHVGAIHVHLASVLMDDFSHLLDSAFVFSGSGREGDHVCSEFVLVFLGLFSKVFHIDSAVIAFDSDHLEPCQNGARRISSVGGLRNQANVAVALSIRLEVLGNGQQARVLATRPTVGLEANFVEFSH